MLDFLMISTRSMKGGIIEIYPKFIIKKSDDVIIRCGDFYTVWIEERGLWSTYIILRKMNGQRSMLN